jgi:hypothetical protein
MDWPKVFPMTEIPEGMSETKKPGGIIWTNIKHNPVNTI